MKRILRSPAMTVFLFVMAVALLMMGSIGGTRAALTIFSDDYQSQLALYDIGVTLLEGTNEVGSRDYVRYSDGRWSMKSGNLIHDIVKDAGDTEFKVGKAYPVSLTVKNSGTIDEYVRVTIYKYWVDASGQKIEDYGWFNGNGGKQLDLDPGLIDLHLVNTGVWVPDTGASTSERTVLYYQNVLGSGATSPAFSDTLTVRGAVTNAVKVTTTTVNGVEKTTYTYAYDDLGFVLEVEVDAVQTHNADAAMRSAWGRSVTG
ncbi:MAG: hypothetical protein IJ179_08185 [Oscillospiraceae bacterium]|nr:hypothetical protein [Oscillospiraceae bacterium]